MVDMMCSEAGDLCVLKERVVVLGRSKRAAARRDVDRLR